MALVDGVAAGWLLVLLVLLVLWLVFGACCISFSLYRLAPIFLPEPEQILLAGQTFSVYWVCIHRPMS
ncbi:MAG: hypothetical protein ACREO9_10720 [Lysobacterales bacterium]